MQSNKDTIIYQIHVPSFFDSDGDGIGDLIGVKERLSYIASLGVTDISLASLLESSDLSETYATTDFTKTDLSCGTTDDLTFLIEAAHEAGLRVILPLPIRAVSKDHPWFINATSSSLHNNYNLYKEYFIWKQPKDKQPPKEYSDEHGGAKYMRHASEEYYLATEKGFPILNLDNPRVRREILDVIAYWKGRSVDAFMLVGSGLTAKIPADGSSNKLSEDLFDIGRTQYKLLRDIREKGILDENTKLYLKNATDRNTIPYLFGTPMLADVVITTSVIDENRYGAKDRFKLSLFLEKSLAPYPQNLRERICNVFEDVEHERLLTYLLEKSAYHAPATKALLLYFFTLPGMLCLYQGQELGMIDRAKGKKGEPCLPMQWDNRMHAGFSSALFPWKEPYSNYSHLNVAAEQKDTESILNFYKQLVLFRKENPLLCSGDVRIVESTNKNVCTFLRIENDEKLFIVCSFSEKEINYALPDELLREKAFCALSNYAVVSRSLHRTIGLRPYEARIYKYGSTNTVKLLR